MNLLEIKEPNFLKKLNEKELNELSQDVRSFIIEKVAKNGGHLSSNLGIVELTIAIHRVFNSPTDKIIFDVGHQCYTHKILTGRASNFDSLRKLNGLSGYIKRNESVHDCWEAGHSSTAIAALAGYEYAREANKEDYYCLAVVGDGSLNSGLSFEALNYLGHQKNIRPIIILNDNDMSISKNVGTMSKLLNSMRSSKTYLSASKKGSYFPKFIRDLKNRVAGMVKGFAKSQTIFDDLGFAYYGPIDGHDIKQMTRYLELAKKVNKPVVLHMITKKGKGYSKAEEDASGVWHGVAPFNVETGQFINENKENYKSWSSIVSEYLEGEAEINPNFRIVVPAMIQGSSLNHFQSRFPNQIIDVGICESFAVCFAGALSLNRLSVFVPIYSSFLQRAYDQISHDVARHEAHVVFGIDRSGLVGEDGETHQGIYDISFLRSIPNIEILQPSTHVELLQLLDYAFHHAKDTVCIRYSKSKIPVFNTSDVDYVIHQPVWKKESHGQKGYVIAYGDQYQATIQYFNKKNTDLTFINALFIRPVDQKMLTEILTSKLPLFIIEDSIASGSLGSEILDFASQNQLLHSNIHIFGLPTQFIEQGSVALLYQKYGLDPEHIYHQIMSLLD